MSIKRALVDCAVLSLQNSCVFYPYCKGCFSRVDVEPQDGTRCRCSRCGYSCPKAGVDYRYRLSLRVARDQTIFGVTVFGTCLNPFFGIHASGLQRLLENSEGPSETSTRNTLLANAVKDCFIGRHFIFGIKITGSQCWPWIGGCVPKGSSGEDTAQFIATQMILPRAAGLGGCSVISYYQRLLQKATECGSPTTDPSKIFRPPETNLLLIPHHSSANSFSGVSLSVSHLLSQSLQRSQCLTPTPPWRQSLGLVTSSAEQEEDCSAQCNGDEYTKQSDNINTPDCSQRCNLSKPKDKKEKMLSTIPHAESTFYHSPSCAPYPSIGNTSNMSSWSSSTSHQHKNDLRLSADAKTLSTKTLLSRSLALDDLPFSESLTEFLLEENQDFNVFETDHQKTTRNESEIRSHNDSLSIKCLPVYQSITPITESPSQILVDITNTVAQNNIEEGRDLSDQAFKGPAQCMNMGQARDISSAEIHQKQISLGNDADDTFKEDVYNCSADLFSSSITSAMNAEELNIQAEVNLPKKVEGLPLILDQQYLKGRGRDSLETILSQDQSWDESTAVNTTQCDSSQSLDFVPPSQSTPIVKVDISSSYRTAKLRVGLHTEQRSFCACEDSKACRNTPSSRTLKRRSWRLDRQKHHQHQVSQRKVLNFELNGKANHKSDLSFMTESDFENNDVIVPPTPAAKTPHSTKFRRRGGKITNSGVEQEQANGVSLKSVSSLMHLTPTGNGSRRLTFENEVAAVCGNFTTLDKRNLEASNNNAEDEACDLSRDLFSDFL